MIVFVVVASANDQDYGRSIATDCCYLLFAICHLLSAGDDYPLPSLQLLDLPLPARFQ
jgi:hypothetical protein